MVKTTVLEQTGRARVRALPHRPLHRLERIVVSRAQARETADVEASRPAIVQARKTRMLVENLVRPGVREIMTEAHAPGDLADDPPVWLRFPRRGQEGPLARD